jgi:CubicO group peptidase (beta-lactamase class C family)
VSDPAPTGTGCSFVGEQRGSRWSGRLRRAVAALVGVSAALAGTLVSPAGATAAEADVREQIVQAVADQIPGAQVVPGTEEPLLGVPGVTELAAGRAEVMLDPAFWTQVVGNLLVSRTIVLPTPVDVVKPEMYLPTALVRNGSYVWPLPRREVDLSGLRYEWQGRKKSLRDFVRSTETDIVAFVRNGRIVTDLYANGWSADMRHQPWSVTKSFVSAVVGVAVDEGRVASVEDPIDRYVRELRGTAWEGTTIRNLLEMESGVHWDESTPVLAENTQVQQWIQAAVDLYTDGRFGQGRNEFLKSLPRVAPQGTEFSYNSGNTQVLAWLTESLYRKPFNEVIAEKLWIPTGMAGDARMLTDRVGDVFASQGLYARVFDLARFGELFRNRGRTPDGRRVVSRGWVRESTTMTRLSEGRYAYQWWTGSTPDGYNASGFQGQKISVSPANCLTGVRLSHTLGANLSSGSFEVEMGADEWTAVYQAVAARLGGCPPADRGLRLRGRCEPSGLRATLGGPARSSVRRVRFRGERGGSVLDRRAPFRRLLGSGHFSGGRWTVRATAQLADGRTARIRRTVRGCRGTAAGRRGSRTPRYTG